MVICIEKPVLNKKYISKDSKYSHSKRISSLKYDSCFGNKLDAKIYSFYPSLTFYPTKSTLELLILQENEKFH